MVVSAGDVVVPTCVIVISADIVVVSGGIVVVSADVAVPLMSLLSRW